MVYCMTVITDRGTECGGLKMRIEDLRYLIQVAELGSINSAAEVCYITQQGMSRIISSLENELGVRLFYRINNRLVLTDIGELVVARAKELDEQYQHMLRDVSRASAARGSPAADYHIYTTQLISSTLLLRVLSSLNLHYPGIALEVEEFTPPEIADKVEFNAHTVGIISMTTFHEAASLRLNSGELVFDHYYQDELMLGVSARSPLAERSVITTAELAATPLALCNDESLMIRELLPEGISPAVALHISSYDLCREMISRNRAAGLTSVLRNYYCHAQNPIRAVPLEKTATVSYGCIYDPDIPRTPFLRTLFSIVSSELGRVH